MRGIDLDKVGVIFYVLELDFMSFHYYLYGKMQLCCTYNVNVFQINGYN